MSDDDKDKAAKVVYIALTIVGLFILMSLVGQFLLVWSGRLDSDVEGVWRPLLDLVALIVGAIIGWVGRGSQGGDGG